MSIEEVLKFFLKNRELKRLKEKLRLDQPKRFHVKRLVGSSAGFVATTVCNANTHLFILNDRVEAAYFYNDLHSLNLSQSSIVFFSSSYKLKGQQFDIDNTLVSERISVLNNLSTLQNTCATLIVTYPEAIGEMVVNKEAFLKSVLEVKAGGELNTDFLTERLNEYGFNRSDFAYEAGEFSIRGGIIDIYSYGNLLPYRIELHGNHVESIRTFDPANQLSLEQLTQISVLPDMHTKYKDEIWESFFNFLLPDSVVWLKDVAYAKDIIDTFSGKISSKANLNESESELSLKGRQQCLSSEDFVEALEKFKTVEFGTHFYFPADEIIELSTTPQPPFHKDFNLLFQHLNENIARGGTNIIFADTPKQSERLVAIFSDLSAQQKNINNTVPFEIIQTSLHEGFFDKELNIACYTDHQIFDRFHRYRLHDSYSKKESISLKELKELKPGDYVTHIDHGVGKFMGLEKIEVNGKWQEAIRMVYKDNDLLYVSIHSLYKIAKYRGKEGTEPQLNKLGSAAWNSLKLRTKKKVKDIAKDLILLYAKRKAQDGNAFSPDTYLQTELEASFIYEDTPDQLKTTMEVKKDMEEAHPMDRLICGDVGFGKTEIAIRAAFKAVTDNKQVAVLSPTTILTMQHYKTFSERLKEFPCSIDYLNRFKSVAEQKETIRKLADGNIDIIIGTHRLVSKDIKFKDLGLLIIDEEQKFGVTVKEKLRQMRVNVDTLTLTATPIPRTLQFSLLGARDLSIINTAPPNRLPIHTELHRFNDEVIQQAIRNEIMRGGQVFFLHNHIKNILEIASLIKKLCPEVRVTVGHGQMESKKLEKTIVDFINGDYDVLVSTTIIESGLDIPNANTIIINEAHSFGLSDLYQIRGRVGRSNRKAYCYLLSPPLSAITDEARKRLSAIEEFTDLGSGFNIAMRDLDIRGAGNLLGGEQSGFITEIGFDMYHKILDEAVQELKNEEFKELFAEADNAQKQKCFVKECQVETDLQILIPDDYMNSIQERLKSYGFLNTIEEESKLKEFIENLKDRFGPLPVEANELMNTVRLRWLGRELGMEKIALKNTALKAYFPSGNTQFFETDVFANILNYVQSNPSKCNMKQISGNLILQIQPAKNVSEAIETLEKMKEIKAMAY